MCPDYIGNIDKTITLMRKSYYMDRLAPLLDDQFDGFVPRSYIPATDLAKKSAAQVSHKGQSNS